MKPILCLAALLLVFRWSVHADEPWMLFDGCRWGFQGSARHGSSAVWCPDDYCRKPLP